MSSPDPLQVLRLPPPSLIQASARRRSPPITSPHLHLRARRAVMHHPTPLINNSCYLLLAEVETKVSGPERTMKTAAADGRRCHQEEAKAIKCAAFEGFVGPPAWWESIFNYSLISGGLDVNIEGSGRRCEVFSKYKWFYMHNVNEYWVIIRWREGSVSSCSTGLNCCAKVRQQIWFLDPFFLKVNHFVREQ